MTYTFFATCPKAMENLLAEELVSLGADEVKPTIAGVHFSGDIALAYKVCLWSRLANRILLHLDSFFVKNQDDLYRGVQHIDWSLHLNPEGSFAVTFNSKNSTAICNSHFGALKVKDAIVDQMREKFSHRPNIDTEHPDIRINVILNGESAAISLDLSGESLHRRSYRDINIKAPIKENLAAALLIRSSWPDIANQGGALFDPMCGSGTLLIEAAMIVADYAPGLLRNYYGFLGWRQHDQTLWNQLKEEAKQRKKEGLKKLPVIVGYDHNRRNLEAAKIHIKNAGLDKFIQVECRDISSCKADKIWHPGLVICNPPYGGRLGDQQEIALLYKQFGQVLKMHFQGWQAAMIVGDAEMGFRLGIRSHKPITFFNGALECKLLRMSVEEKNFFQPKAKTTEDRISEINQLVDDPWQAFKKKNESKETARNQPQVTPTQNTVNEDETSITPTFITTEINQNQLEIQKIDASDFCNRLKKNLNSLSAWKNKNNISCYRIYDADLPDYAIAIDLYEDENNAIWLNVQEYEPPKTIDPHKANRRLAGVIASLPSILNIPKDHVFLKIRRKQKLTDQYEKLANQAHFHNVKENGCRLQVNFSDYLDTGLFLDHRPLRWLIQQKAKGKRFLNLFAYTGSATVIAAVGGAVKTTTVDMSKTYLDWAKKNLALNNCSGEHEFIQADCLEWLEKESRHPYPRQYDLIFLDPPTFSNSKRMDDIFEIQQDHVLLIKQAISLLAKDGMLYFSTNFRRFKLDFDALSAYKIEDISAQTIPADFVRNPKIHYCWRIKK